ncbi:MAG: ApaG domain [Alphaproteobacteria bacterium]|nr:ApaG domain [Alphaproteobacteria bacterium]
MYCNEDFYMAQEGGIVISAYPELLDEKAANGEFCWGYYLRIENNSDEKISLLGKSISVTDTKGNAVSAVYNGFNGQTPVLEPGEVFEFEDYATSKASAVLSGSCLVESKKNRQIKNIDLPVLSLIANDNAQRVLN